MGPDQVAHLGGERLLVGLGGVGPVAVAAPYLGHQVGVRLGEPGEVDLAHARPQVQQHGRDRGGAGLDARLHDGVELVGAVGQAGEHGRHQHAASRCPRR